MIAFAVAAALLAQDSLTTREGEVLQGTIREMTRDARIVLLEGEAVREVHLEHLLEIRFGPGPDPQAPSAPFLRLRYGLRLSGAVEGLEEGRLRVRSAYGPVTVPRADLLSLRLAEGKGTRPEGQEPAPGDLLTLAPSAEKPVELRIVGGAVRAILEDRVLLDQAEIPRDEVLEIRFEPADPAPAGPDGWFARVRMRNGDRLAGAIREIGPDRVGLFHHGFGSLSLPRADVAWIGFGTQPRFSMGHLLVTDNTGIHALDGSLQEVWFHAISGAASARKLDSGNILAAVPSEQAVLEIRPKAGGGGEIVNRFPKLGNVRDAIRIGTTTYVIQDGQVAALDAGGERLWRRHVVRNPASLEAMEDGTLLVAGVHDLVRANAKGEVVHRYPLSNLRLRNGWVGEDGTILVCDMQGNRIVELDAQGKELGQIMPADGRAASDVFRREDGHTFFTDNRRLTELGWRGKPSRTKGMNNPICITGY